MVIVLRYKVSEFCYAAKTSEGRDWNLFQSHIGYKEQSQDRRPGLSDSFAMLLTAAWHQKKKLPDTGYKSLKIWKLLVEVY